MIKCIALDLDGTLLLDGSILSEKAEAVLKKAIEKDIHIVIASGRAFSTLPKAVTGIPGVEYAITSNGAAVYSVPTGECLQVHKLLPEAVNHIIAIVERLKIEMKQPYMAYEAFVDGTAYASEAYIKEPGKYGATRAAWEYVRTTRKPVPDMIAFMKEHQDNLDSIDIIVPTEEEKLFIWDILKKEENRIYITSSVKQLLEVSDMHAGKKEGLRFVLEKIGASPKEAVAFGNADNDADMLEYAGIGVAVADATSGCLAVADEICGHHQEDGVAKWIETRLEG